MSCDLSILWFSWYSLLLLISVKSKTYSWNICQKIYLVLEICNAMIGYGSQFILHVLWPCWLYIYILSFCIFRLEKSHIMPDFRSRQSEATTLIEIGIFTVYTNPSIIYRGWPQQFILRLFLIREFVEICEFVKSLIREEDRL